MITDMPSAHWWNKVSSQSVRSSGLLVLTKKRQGWRCAVHLRHANRECSNKFNPIQGAKHLARYLEREYGPDSFALLLDEGGGK